MVVPSGKVIRVEIMCNASGCKVNPGIVDGGIGDMIEFHNLTTDDVHFQFSEERLFSEANNKVSTGVIHPGEHKDVMVQRVPRAIYPYSIYCKCLGQFATASSMPIIIIKH